MSKWLKKGDKVVVITGNDKGRTGTVLRRGDDTVVIQGINIRKKHAKRQGQAQTPTILEREMPLHISKVQYCDEEDHPVRLRSRITDGIKEVYYSKNKKDVVVRTIGKGA